MFVPMPQQPQARVSTRARELSRKLEDTIEEFERYYPNTSSGDVRQALDLLREGSSPARRQASGAVAGGLVAMALGGVVFYRFAGGESPISLDSPMTMMWIVAGLGILFAIIAILRMRDH